MSLQESQKISMIKIQQLENTLAILDAEKIKEEQKSKLLES